ncbi:MAG: hydroxyacid dehydrogenase [Desulfobacterales bacterium]|nr:MAG: hydroxyacid dehydrogenase [Desulfobacterales bacterium]
MNVLLPQPIESEAVNLLEQANCAVTVAPNSAPETVLPLMKTAHGLILRTGLTITRDLIAEADDLMVISRTGGGLDNVDVDAATEKGIIVTSNLGVNTVSVVEHVLSLMLSLSKKLPELDRAVRGNNFGIRYQNLPRDVNGKILGLLGFGRIGSEIGRICRQIFSMRIIAFDPCLPEKLKASYAGQVAFVQLQELLTESDVLSIHVPLSDESRQLVGASQLSMMKADAILINTSRGGVVDEPALIKALQENTLGAAGLDVFSQEPVAPDNPLLKLENVILTPHTAALTRECVIRMATEAARCVLDVFGGREPPNVANREVLKTEKWKHLLPMEPM